MMTELNYYSDPRVRASERGPWFESFDATSMVATVTLEIDGDEAEHEVKCRYEVCPTCGGRGKHVNPSIDAGGLTGSDIAELDGGSGEFLNGYTWGVYDVSCYECKGAKVVPEPIESDESDKILRALAERAEEDASYAAERESERRMGC